MDKFDPCGIPLPVTGAPGGGVFALLLGSGLLIVACGIYGTRRKNAPVTLGLALLLASLAATMNLSLRPAFADEAPAPCPTPTTHPVATVSVTPAPVQTTAPVEPTVTPAPTLTPTPTTTPLPMGTISGTYTRVGSELTIYDPPGDYTGQLARNDPPWENVDFGAPDGTVRLPTVAPVNGPIGAMTMNLVTPGADGVFATADDQITATTQTAPDGRYAFANLPGGRYRVAAATLPADPVIPAVPTWRWGAVCRLDLGLFAAEGSVPQPIDSLKYQVVVPAARSYDVTLAENQVVGGQDFNAQGRVVFSIGCK